MDAIETKDQLSAFARKGAEHGAIPGVKMCNDCAFKKGTEANNCAVSTEAAMSLLQWEGTFCCHTEDYQNNGVCGGFLYAKQYFDNMFKKKDNDKA